MNRVRCIIFNAALGPLDYRVPQGMAVEYGSVVVAPLGPRQVIGIVWEEESLPTDPVPENKLRPLLDVLPVPPLKAELRRLIEWTADYYCASLASVARMVISSGGALRGPTGSGGGRTGGSAGGAIGGAATLPPPEPPPPPPQAPVNRVVVSSAAKANLYLTIALPWAVRAA